MTTSHFTTDSDSTPTIRFYTVEQLGEKRSLTPEGYLLCEDVAIARTGTMIYGPNEVPITAGLDGLIRVHRNEDEVFRAEYIASYAGKPVVNDHPPVDVDPSNWKQYAVGVVMNPRRGVGLQADLLIADFLVTDPDAIKDVLSGKREVSCGYDADYVEIGRGEGKQTNMIGNHVALVESGRCGPRCAIGDKKTIKEDEMKFKDNKSKFLDSKIGKLIMAAFAAKDATALQSVIDEATPLATRDSEGTDPAAATADAEKDFRDSIKGALDAINGRLDAIENRNKAADEAAAATTANDAEAAAAASAAADAEAAAATAAAAAAAAKDDDTETADNLKAEAPAGTADAAVKARDCAYLEESFQETVAMAEILVPGIRIPTFDRAADPKAGLDVVCQLRRSALDAAYQTADRDMIDGINGAPLELSGMKCNQVRTLFRGVVTAKRAVTNARQTSDRGVQNPHETRRGPLSIAEVNARNAAHYASK